MFQRIVTLSLLSFSLLTGMPDASHAQSIGSRTVSPQNLQTLTKLYRSPNLQKRAGCDSHAGTVDACPMTIEAGVEEGLVELSSKGLMAGDNISITVDDLTPKQCDAVTVRLFLEFYGPAATQGVALIVKDAIESIWSGHTSTDGKKVSVEVVTTVALGDTLPPNTPGFHQINVFDQAFRDVVHGMGTDFDINRGSGAAEWDAGAENSQFAHEAGHLMMFPDFYDDYTRMPGDIWKNETDGTTVTTTQLAELFIRNFPSWTLAQRLQYLQQFSVGKGISLSKAGHETDIMANYDLGTVQQWEVDELAARADGIVVKIPPGTITIPKSGRTQGMVVTHEEHLHVQKGQKKRCDGLYGACINGDNAVPDPGDAFDLLPPLGSWPDTTMARLLLKVVQGIDRKRWYDKPWLAQSCVWRLTNNTPPLDTTVANFLRSLGIDSADVEYRFPSLVNPDSATAGTNFTLSPGLAIPIITPRATLVPVGSPVLLSGSVRLPSVVDPAVRLAWSIAGPDSSRSGLADPSSGTLRFTPDVRGAYNPVMNVLVRRGNNPERISGRLTDAYVVAADAMTETFESNSLRHGAPFFWSTTAEAPWIVSDSASFTGRYALRALPAQPAFASIVGATFSLPDSGALSFAFRAATGRLVFLDGFRDTVLSSNHEHVSDWSYTTVRLGPGVHAVSWSYYDGSADSSGAMVGTGAWLDDIFFPPDATPIRTSAEETAALSGFSLSQNNPNPFAGETEIRYSLAKSENVTLTLHDLLGREVRRLVDEPRPAGANSLRLTSAGLPRGIYFYRLTAGPFNSTRKMTVVR